MDVEIRLNKISFFSLFKKTLASVTHIRELKYIKDCWREGKKNCFPLTLAGKMRTYRLKF